MKEETEDELLLNALNIRYVKMITQYRVYEYLMRDAKKRYSHLQNQIKKVEDRIKSTEI